MKKQLLQLMKSNVDLMEASIKLYIENQKLQSQVDILKDRCALAIKEKERVLTNLTQNPN